MNRQIKALQALPKLEKLTRVAAYARVSSGKDAMLHSLSQQVNYYCNLIQTHPDWEYAGVYADEAYTGTKDERPEFLKLIAACKAGQVDMILTKSISRFARNTVTLLNTVRSLKALGIDVYFEEQNIHSLSSDGELMLTILASYAQEESRSVSENVKWRIRKGFQNGELINWNFMYGYRISKKEGVQIEASEAAIVRDIFKKAIAGNSLESIAKGLNRSGHLGLRGGKWKSAHIRELLQNEKYTGNALLQKQFVVDHMTKKEIENKGELPQYYATETHPAIIDQSTFDEAQTVLQRIVAQHGPVKSPSKHEFTGMIVCPKCGRNFKYVKSNRSPAWICPTYYEEGKAACMSKKIPDATIKKLACIVIGTSEFDSTLFQSTVKKMVATGANELTFYFTDGRVEPYTWKDRSRAESWDSTMRQQAAERMRRRYHG